MLMRIIGKYVINIQITLKFNILLNSIKMYIFDIIK